MLYSKAKKTKLLRKEAYDFIIAFNRNINKAKAKNSGKTMLTGKPKK